MKPISVNYASSGEKMFARHSVEPTGAFGRILVVVDPVADAHPCIEKAARIALTCRSELEMYICDAEQDFKPEFPDLGLAWAVRHEELLEKLDRLAMPLRERGLAVDVKCERGASLEQGIGYHVLRTRPDLVVKDTHRHGSPARGNVALTDWILMRQISVPLLLVRPNPWPERPRITVSTDPCHPAERAATLDESMLATGCELGVALHAELDVLHVLQPPPHLPGDEVSAAAKLRKHAAAREEVERLVADGNVRCIRRPIHFVEGRVADRVIEFAEHNQTDILIMGAAARARWLNAAGSGTAAQIVETVGCDLLLVKPPGFVSPLLVTDD
jgi:universal stress protein E